MQNVTESVLIETDSFLCPLLINWWVNETRTHLIITVPSTTSFFVSCLNHGLWLRSGQWIMFYSTVEKSVNTSLVIFLRRLSKTETVCIFIIT